MSRTSYCKAARFLGVQFQGGGAPQAVIALCGLGERKLSPHMEGKGHGKRKHMISVTKVQPGQGRSECLGLEAPDLLCPLFHTLPSPLPSCFPPAHKLLLVLFWTLEIHR